MPICEAGNPVLWSNLQSLMVGAMAAAETLGVSNDVDNPVEDSESVWSLPDPIAVTFAQTFLLGPDNVTVTSTYLSPGLGAFGAWRPPSDALRPLAEERELVFISEEDGCWCKTMWRVVVSGGGFTLEATTAEEKSFGCCPSIPVPVPGDALDYSQVWMPAAHMVAAIARPGKPRDIEVPKCITVGGGCLFRITSTGLVAVQRELTGRLSWVIKPKHFQDILDKLDEISDASGGAKLDKVRKASLNVQDAPPEKKEKLFLCEMARVKVRDILFTLRIDEELEELTEPGCLDLPDTKCAIKYPWIEATCEGETCEGSDGLKVYCNTLKILDILVARLEQYLNPKDFVNDCGLTVEEERTGQQTQCEYRTYPSGAFSGLSHYTPDMVLPEYIQIIETAFEVDQCNTTVCLGLDDSPLLVMTSAKYRVFVMYLEDLFRQAYNVWLADIATKAKSLTCFAHWTFGADTIPGIREVWTELDTRYLYYIGQEPIIMPAITGSYRFQCTPSVTRVGTGPLGDYLSWPRVRIAGPLECNQTLKHAEDAGAVFGGGLGVKGETGMIIMGYQMISANITETEAAGDIDDLEAFCLGQQGFGGGGSDLAPIYSGEGENEHRLEQILPTNMSTYLQIQCLWGDKYLEEEFDPPFGVPWLHQIHFGNSTPAYPTLFEHECDNEA